MPKILVIIFLVLLFLYMSPIILGALVTLFFGIIALSWNILWFLVLGAFVYLTYKYLNKK